MEHRRESGEKHVYAEYSWGLGIYEVSEYMYIYIERESARERERCRERWLVWDVVVGQLS